LSRLRFWGFAGGCELGIPRRRRRCQVRERFFCEGVSFAFPDGASLVQATASRRPGMLGLDNRRPGELPGVSMTTAGGRAW
jgi:hypothetical protein